MQEELVSFKTAKLAKEKGFNLNSPGFYSCDNPSSGIKGNKLILREWEKWINFGSEDSQEGTLTYSAPTQSLLQKWLREVHKINLEINYSECGWWIWHIINKDLYIDIFGTNETDDIDLTYEEALEAGLQEALKLI